MAVGDLSMFQPPSASQQRRGQRLANRLAALELQVQALQVACGEKSDSTILGSNSCASDDCASQDSWEKEAPFVQAACQCDLVVAEIVTATPLASVSCQTDAVVSFFIGEALDECVTVGSQTEFIVNPHVDCQLVCDGATMVESGFKALDVQIIASMRECQDLVDSLLNFELPLPPGLVTMCVPAPCEPFQSVASLEIPHGSLDVDSNSIKHSLAGFGIAMRDFVASAHAALDLAVQDQDDFGMPVVSDGKFIESELYAAHCIVMKLDGLRSPQPLALECGIVIGTT